MPLFKSELIKIGAVVFQENSNTSIASKNSQLNQLEQDDDPEDQVEVRKVRFKVYKIENHLLKTENVCSS